MKIRPTTNRRGSALFALAGILVVVVSLCGIALDRSLEQYRSTADLEQRLRTQAAIEAAAAWLLYNPLAEQKLSIELPNVKISQVGERDRTAAVQVVQLSIDVTNKQGAVIRSTPATLSLTPNSEVGTWTVTHLEI